MAIAGGVVGREAELAEVDRFLEASRSGFAALMLEGEAGIGKTTLWSEAQRRAEQLGGRVLSCRPAAAEAKLSFAALADILSAVDGATVEALPGPQRDALLVAQLRRPTGRGPIALAAAVGLLGVIRALAATAPVVVAVDDWQWLDRSSRRALEFAVRRLASEPVGLLCSQRSPSVAAPLGDLVPGELVRRVVLGPMSLAALGRIVAARLGQSLPRPVLVRIAQASHGNPFYALEIARLIVEQGDSDLSGSRFPVPEDLRRLAARRVRGLPAATREGLLLAAVLSSPDSRVVDVAALGPAEEAGLVTIDDRGRIEFAHPLFASAAYGSVPLGTRRELHRRAAALVSDPEQRARHLALGSEGTDAKIARKLDQAAASAASRGAPDAGAELARLAAQLTPPEDGAQLGERLLAAAHFLFDAGDLMHAEGLARETLAGSTIGQLRARALQLAAQLCARRSNFTEARDLAAAALEAAGDDHALRSRIELDLVYCAVSLGDLSSALPHAHAAVAQAEQAADTGVLGDALAVLTMAEFLSGRNLDDVRLSRALSLDDPLMERAFIMRPRVIQGMLQLWTGELGAALETLGHLYLETIERGLEGTAPMLSLYLVWAHVWRGDIEQAARLSDQAREAAVLLEDPATVGIALSASALAHAHDGRGELARGEAAEALALFERVQWRSGMIWPLWAIGLAELADGSPERADAVLRPLTDQLARMGAGDPAMAMFLPDEIEALIALGEFDLAQGYLEPFEARAREFNREWAVAAAERCRGTLAAARGDAQRSFTAFDLALTWHGRAGMPLERARTLLLAGQAYRRYKQHGRARRALTEAVAVFERHGAPSWAARARGELARVGGRTSSGDELSATEQRVVELAARGLSNREIAERAFVSIKTVEAAITRAYRKLGVHSRASLAATIQADGPVGATGDPIPRP